MEALKKKQKILLGLRQACKEVKKQQKGTLKKVALLLIVLIIMICTENTNFQISRPGEFQENDPYEDFISGKYAEALSKFRVILEKNPKDLYTQSLFAYCYWMIGDYKNSKKEANQVINEISTDLIKTNPNLRLTRAWALLTLGEVKIYDGDVQEAMRIINEAIKTAPSLATPHSALGDILCMQQKYEEAISAYDMALKIDPKYERARGGKVRCLYSQGKYSEALNMIERALRESPQNPYLLNERGIIFFELQNYSEAEKNFREALKKSDDAGFWAELGNVLDMQDKFAEAEKAYNTAIALKPNEREFHFNLALCLARQEKLAQALREIEAEEKLGVVNPVIYQLKILILNRLGRDKEAGIIKNKLNALLEKIK